MKIYYAHCINTYGTKQEQRDMDIIGELFPNCEIYNPSNDSLAEEGYKSSGMLYFLNIVKSCNLLVFRGLPNKKIPSGVFKEIKTANESNIPVLEIPCYTEREMSIEDTRNYLREVGYR
jgi:hypothetical protein